MLQATSGLVLRSVKYGETSLITTIYTKHFGIQTYLLQGVRSNKKNTAKAARFQPATLLDMVVYHQANKNLQRIREAEYHHVYRLLPASVLRYAVAVFVCELILKTLTEPETNESLYLFLETFFIHLDDADEKAVLDMPVRFTLEWATHMGFGIQNRWQENNPVLDFQNGCFTAAPDLPSSAFAEEDISKGLSDCLYPDASPSQTTVPKRKLLEAGLHYLRWHLPGLGMLKSMDVLQDVLHA